MFSPKHLLKFLELLQLLISIFLVQIIIIVIFIFVVFVVVSNIMFFWGGGFAASYEP